MLTDEDLDNIRRITQKYLTKEDLQRLADLPRTRNLIGRVSKEACARIIFREMIDVARRTGKVTKGEDNVLDELMARGGLEEPYSGKPFLSSTKPTSGLGWVLRVLVVVVLLRLLFVLVSR